MSNVVSCASNSGASTAVYNVLYSVTCSPGYISLGSFAATTASSSATATIAAGTASTATTAVSSTVFLNGGCVACQTSLTGV